MYSLYIDPDMKAAVETLAKEQGQSTSEMMRNLLGSGLQYATRMDEYNQTPNVVPEYNREPPPLVEDRPECLPPYEQVSTVQRAAKASGVLGVEAARQARLERMQKKGTK